MLKSLFGGCYSALFDNTKILYKKISGNIDADENRLEIDNTIKRLEEENKQSEKDCKEFTKKASEYVLKKNNKAALIYLKKKKVYQARIQKNLNLMNNLEQMKIAMETAKSNKDTFGGYKDGVDLIKKLNKEINVDDVLDTVDDMTEAIKDQEEINDALARPLDGEQIEEDEDLLEELKELQDDTVDNIKIKKKFSLTEEDEELITFEPIKKRIKDINLKDYVDNEEELKKIIGVVE